MWKKTDNESNTFPAGQTEPPTPDLPAREPIKPPAAGGRAGHAVIGPSISINGDIKGEEDLVVLGLVEGSLTLRNNSLTVGNQGRVTANVTANSILVEGNVRGELNALDYVIIKPSGHVSGDIRAPRVVLEDGCRFKGSIDMENVEKTAKAAMPNKVQPVSAEVKKDMPGSAPQSQARKNNGSSSSVKATA